MGIFGSKKNTKPEKKTAVAESAKVVAPSKSVRVQAKEILLRPRITEKAANLTSENIYTFDVAMNASKQEVKDAVEALYKVRPTHIRIVRIPAKRVAMRKRRGFGRVSAIKKAYVHLKKGDSITFA